MDGISSSLSAQAGMVQRAFSTAMLSKVMGQSQEIVDQLLESLPVETSGMDLSGAIGSMIDTYA